MLPPTPSFDRAARPSAREDVEFRQAGGGWVLFDPVAQRIHVLDVTAALVWSYCTGEMEVGAMEAEIRRAFGAALPAGQDPGVQKARGDFAAAGLLLGAP